MKNEIEMTLVPNEVQVEADNLSKETRIPFRECLGLVMTAYLTSLEEVEDKRVRTC